MSFVLEQNYAYYRALRDKDAKAHRSTVRLLRSSRDYLIQTVRKNGKTFVELNHEFAPFGPLLAEAFPDAKFVHLVRDPRFVVASFMTKFDPPPMELDAFMGTRHSFLGQYVLRHQYVRSIAKLGPRAVRDFVELHRFDTQLHPFEKVNGKWRERREMTAFEKTCWYWNAVNEHILDFLDQLSEERKRQISFEAFFDRESLDSRGAFLQFVGVDDLTLQDAGEFFKERLNIKEIHRSFPATDQWDQGMLCTLDRFCGETMERLGYRRDQSSVAADRR